MESERTFLPLSAIPYSIDKASPINVGGERLRMRGLTKEEEMDALAHHVQTSYFASKSSPSKFFIYCSREVKREVYIDYDLTLRTKEEHPLDDVQKALSEDLRGVARDFCGIFLSKLLALGQESSRDREAYINGARDRKIQALFSIRSSPTSAYSAETRDYGYKTGFHCHTSRIRASPIAAVIAMRKAKELMSFGNLFHNTAGLFKTETVADDKTLRGGFDEQPLTGATVLPGCIKVGGKVAYSPERIFNFRVAVSTSNGSLAALHGEFDTYGNQDLRPFFPIMNVPDTEVITIPDISDVERVPIADPPKISLADEMTLMCAEAKGVDPELYRTIELLRIIPVDRYANNEGHLNRLRMTNAVTCALSGGKSATPEQRDWMCRIMIVLFRMAAHGGDPAQPHTGDYPPWASLEHVSRFVDDAITAGDKVHGLNYIRKQARMIDESRVMQLDACYSSESLLSTLRRFFFEYSEGKKCDGKAELLTNMHAGELLYRSFGNKYLPRTGESKKEETQWFRYDTQGTKGGACGKWSYQPKMESSIFQDIRNILYPALDQAWRENAGNSVAAMAEKMATASRKGKNPENFQSYVRCVKDKLGMTSYVNNTLPAFHSCYEKANQDFDMEDDVVGVLNGVLVFSPEDGKVTLSTGDNRHLYVSRSLNAVYHANTEELAPYMAKVLKIFKTIIPNQEELDYIFLAMGCPLLTRRCGGKYLYIWYGTGGDGKTTLCSAFESLAGRSTGDFRGYACMTSAAVLQFDKTDAGAHDANVYQVTCGPRWWSIGEAGSAVTCLDGGAIKKFVDAGFISLRPIYGDSKDRWTCATPNILTNHPLDIANPTVGEYRRIRVVYFPIKFYPENEAERFKGLPGRVAGDPAINTIFTTGADAPFLRDALLHIILGYIPTWYKKYGADTGKIPKPESMERITDRFLGSGCRVIMKFSDKHLERAVSEDATTTVCRTSLVEVLERYSIWERGNTRGSSFSQTGSKKVAQKNAQGGTQSDPWTIKVLNMISSSPLSSYVVVKGDDGRFSPVGASELPMIPQAALYIEGYRLRPLEGLIVL